MNTVYVDSSADEALRRERLYQGQLFVLSPRPSTIALIEHARDMIETAFGGIDPQLAQYEMSVERYVEICAPLKPAFIHNDTTKRLLRNVVEDFGCVLDDTYVDVPRLRMVTSDGYLTSGVGYAHHPHRDTWYSAPMCQTNWWMPVYPVSSDNVMAFHPKYMTQGIKNGSRRYDYAEWNRSSRQDAAKHIGKDTRDQPTPEEPVELDPQVRVVPEVGGMMVFSGNQLHSSVPNTSGRTRFSIDFRVVDIDDVAAGRGSVNVDSECTGTTLRDFRRASDLAPMPEELAAAYDGVASPV